MYDLFGFNDANVEYQIYSIKANFFKKHKNSIEYSHYTFCSINSSILKSFYYVAIAMWWSNMAIAT